jgi:hypothetical protein
MALAVFTPVGGEAYIGGFSPVAVRLAAVSTA